MFPICGKGGILIELKDAQVFFLAYCFLVHYVFFFGTVIFICFFLFICFICFPRYCCHCLANQDIQSLAPHIVTSPDVPQFVTRRRSSSQTPGYKMIYCVTAAQAAMNMYESLSVCA